MAGAPPSQSVPIARFTSYQTFVVVVLAFVQFTVILDFMILSPLGAILMDQLGVTPSQFGLVVSVYAFSAGLSGLLTAGFADRFDRKSLLMFFYAGFVLGTLLCGLAPNYAWLVTARMVTGVFGGVLGSVLSAIVTDIFPMSMRGRVMGTIQTAFATSQVLGIPMGLFFANHWGWQAPFFFIVAMSSIMGVVIMVRLKPIRDHLAQQHTTNAFEHLWETVTQPSYLQAFIAVGLLSTGGFMLMPFGSAFTVHNMGISVDSLPMLYMATGVCSMVSGPLVGRLSDTLGKFRMFAFGSAVTVVMVYVYTHLETTPLAAAVAVSAAMFVGVSSRMIPSQALMTAIPAPASRGSFMSISAAVRQVSGGLGALLAGWIVHEGAGGHIEHFEELGYVVIGASLITIVMMYRIDRQVKDAARLPGV